MPLPAGARLGPYEIVAVLGAGGMGEVYRARDPRLRREVAIKVLPAAFAADSHRLQRFEQESRAAAALNHPNILAVFDVGRDGSEPFIVSEVLDGETLRDRLQTGALPMRKAIDVAQQIANGLAAAHERGIIHRDLKPENLFVTRDNRVKILDFGLAKLAEQPLAGAGATAAVTAASATQPGVVLGTVGYMAPEQVRGIAVDHRADLFAFGAVLYELLSGQRAFARATAAETMTAILHEEPRDLQQTEVTVAPALARIVHRCLEKDPSARFQSASDLGFALAGFSDSSATSTATASVAPRQRRVLAWAGWLVALAAVIALAPFAYRHVREQQPQSTPIRFQISPTVDFAGPGNFSLSPDGRHVVFVGQGGDGIHRLWMRDLDSLAVRPLPGSETLWVTPPPFWSPDSRFVAFDGGGKLKKIDVSGGLPQTLGDLPGVGVGGTWNRAGDILVGNVVGGLVRVRETGGPFTPVTRVDPSQKEQADLLPTFLPDGRHFIFLRRTPDVPEASGVFVASLDDKDQQPRRLLPYVIGPTYVASTNGHGWLVYLREGTLTAQAFDANRLELTSDPIPVVERVTAFRDGGYFAASTNDVLVYRSAEADAQLTWYDRQGNVAARVAELGPFRDVALAPDGTRAVVSRTNQQDATKADLWIVDLRPGGAATRLTFGAGLAEHPIWSRDGQSITFTFDNNTLRQISSSGAGENKELLRSASVNLLVAHDWSPDGRFLLYNTYEKPENTAGSVDLAILPRGAGAAAVPFANTTFNEATGRYSPDGRWVAYVSNQSGANEIYVRRFGDDFRNGSAAKGASILVSRGGGNQPRWRGDGRELFYVAPNGNMMRVEVSADPEFRTIAPSVLFPMPAGAILGDVASDGKRFLMATPTGPSASMFTVVLHWTAALKR